MNSLYALVVAIQLTTGGTQDAVMGVYESEQDCYQAAAEQEVKNGECWPVEGVIHTGEKPATLALNED